MLLTALTLMDTVGLLRIRWIPRAIMILFGCLCRNEQCFLLFGPHRKMMVMTILLNVDGCHSVIFLFRRGDSNLWSREVIQCLLLTIGIPHHRQ